jgi:AraC family transcriptional regulator of arabinose operon
VNDREPAAIDIPPTTPGIVVAGRMVQRVPRRVRRRAGTRDWLIFFTLGGEGNFRVGEETTTAHPGDVTLIPPGVPHDYGSWRGDWDFLWAHFLARPDWARWLLLPPLIGGLRQLSVTSAANRARIRAAFERLIPDTGAVLGHSVVAELGLNAIEEVLLVCAREARLAQPTRFDRRVETVMELLASDLASGHRLPDLAARVALSPSRLAHLFKTQTGASIFGMLLQMRLEQATRLLAHTTRSIGEVSAALGFASPYYFSRQFRRRYGTSPTNYRSRALRSADGG